jgi:hypothetical protein
LEPHSLQLRSNTLSPLVGPSGNPVIAVRPGIEVAETILRSETDPGVVEVPGAAQARSSVLERVARELC